MQADVSAADTWSFIISNYQCTFPFLQNDYHFVSCDLDTGPLKYCRFAFLLTRRLPPLSIGIAE